MKLVIAEKPSVAREYAKVLGAKGSKEGYIEGNGYLVSWCVGHLIEQKNPNEYDEKYKKWNVEDLPIIPKFEYKVIEEVKKQYKILSEIMKRNDIEEIICGTDAGREGELIFRLVYNYAECKKPFKRLWVSSMTEESLRNGFASLKDGKEFDNMFVAGELRSKADWLVGMNMSRLFSIKHNAKYSVGRVQTPTLKLIIDRDEAIKNFTESKTYGISIKTFKLQADMIDDEDKLYYFENAQSAENLVQSLHAKFVRVIDIKESKKSEDRPLLFSLTSLQQAGVQKYGYTAEKVLEIAQSLYMSKLITYPRTESNYLTDDMKSTIMPLVNKLQSICDGKTVEAQIINRIQEDGGVIDKRQINNEKVSDHHAIIPTGEKPKEITADERNIYSLVCNRFLVSLLKKYEYIEKDIILSTAKQERFRSRSKKVVVLGFKEFFKSEEISSEGENAPINVDIQKGEEMSIVHANIVERVSQPPKRFNDSTLLGQMENISKSIDDEELKEYVKARGLGTPATRASTIERLVKQGFVQREKNNLVGTELGRKLIEILPKELTSPQLTAEWEEKLQRIEHGESIADTFYKDLTSYVSGLVESNREACKNSFKVDTSKPAFAKCPKCGRNMYETSKAYTCENKDCNFAMFKGKDNTYFASLGVAFTEDSAKMLLSKGKIELKGLMSKRTGKTYNATIRLVTDGKFASFKMEF